jgi:hypothetical protein
MVIVYFCAGISSLKTPENEKTKDRDPEYWFRKIPEKTVPVTGDPAGPVGSD